MVQLPDISSGFNWNVICPFLSSQFWFSVTVAVGVYPYHLWRKTFLQNGLHMAPPENAYCILADCKADIRAKRTSRTACAPIVHIIGRVPPVSVPGYAYGYTCGRDDWWR